jgi:hypothetical protein
MLENFLKENGFSFELATLSWPWGTAKYLGDNKGWNVPVMGEPSGGALAQPQVGKFPVPAGPVILPQGQRTHLRPLTDLLKPRGFPGRGAQMLISARGTRADGAEQSQTQRTPNQRSQGQSTSWRGQCQQRQRQLGSAKGSKTPRTAAGCWGAAAPLGFLGVHEVLQGSARWQQGLPQESCRHGSGGEGHLPSENLLAPCFDFDSSSYAAELRC